MMNRERNIRIVGKCGDSHIPSELKRTAWADSELYSTQLAKPFVQLPGGWACLVCCRLWGHGLCCARLPLPPSTYQ